MNLALGVVGLYLALAGGFLSSSNGAIMHRPLGQTLLALFTWIPILLTGYIWWSGSLTSAGLYLLGALVAFASGDPVMRTLRSRP